MKKKRKRAGSIKDNTTAVVWAGPAVGEVVAKKEGGGNILDAFRTIRPSK
jgi:uncharacterized protein YjdB